MPSVDSLIQTICEDAGINDTAGSADHTKALACLQRAYRSIAAQTGCVKELLVYTMVGSLSYKLGGHVTEYPTAVDLTSSFSSRFNSLDHVGVGTTGSAVQAPDFLIDRKPARTVIESQQGNATGDPTMYSCEGGILLLDGAPSSGRDLYLYATLSVPTLAIGGASTTIQGIPESFHEEPLARLATAILLEGWEGEEQRAQYHRNIANDGLAEFRKHLLREGGKLAQSYQIQDFGTPGVIER